jgi:hypothetical protein
MTQAEIEARLAVLYAKQEAATGWGAAVGARDEEIRRLEAQLGKAQAQCSPDIELRDIADDIEQSDGIALMLTGTSKQLGIRRSAMVVAALRASLQPATPTAGEPDAWQYRMNVGGWLPWHDIDMPIDYFCKKHQMHLDNGSCEMRPLYTRPATGGDAVAGDEIERLRTENWQLKQACGYPIPADKETPQNPFKCGICDARALDEAARAQEPDATKAATMPGLVESMANAIDAAVVNWQPGSGTRIKESAARAALDAVNLAQSKRKPIYPLGDDQLSKLWNAIVENTQDDGFWIGEILLHELEKETGFNAASLISSTDSGSAS